MTDKETTQNIKFTINGKFEINAEYERPMNPEQTAMLQLFIVILFSV
jgi:hypothetical protein